MAEAVGFSAERFARIVLDLTAFERRYRNDETGRLAYDPKVLLEKSACEGARGPRTQSGRAAFSRASSRVML